jgi:hypothetical protein
MSITNLATLNNYILNPTNTLTFIQVVKLGISKIDNIASIILGTNYTHTFFDVSSAEIYNKYSTNGKPILLLYLKYNASSTIGTIPLYTTTTTNYIKNFIFLQLSKPTTIEELDLYLKYTKYDTTFIRILEYTPNIKKQYIIDLLEDYNKTELSNYEFFELNQLSILKYYKVKVKTIPSILLFKKSFYNVTGLIPCKYLSGENYYTEQTIIQLQTFLRNGLKNKIG